MTRNQFLSEHWTPYPARPEDPENWWMGRWLNSEGEEARLYRNGQILQPEKIVQAEGEHCDLGWPIPREVLVHGDVVAVNKFTGAVFLLAPCLSNWSIPEELEKASLAQFLAAVRTFFLTAGFKEMTTPFLVTSPGVDHHIDSLSVRGENSGRQWNLPTSPEISLKKKICQGWDQIFEIKSCFRDDFEGPHHRPEFKMLEWYRSYAGLEEIQKDVQSLLVALNSSLGSPFLESQLKLQEVTMAELFRDLLGKTLCPSTSIEELRLWASELDIEIHSSDDWNDIFFRIFMEKIERDLGATKPLIVRGFPPSQSSLARLDQEGWGERFELYWKGVELANAYHELNDPEENKRVFANENQLREDRGASASKLDPELFAELQKGLPPCGGIALGLDRLFMLFSGRSELSP